MPMMFVDYVIDKPKGGKTTGPPSVSPIVFAVFVASGPGALRVRL
jgi:hypothetical protein